ncbi:MAG: carboxylate-amine ligase [Hyphomicrobiales bacterium]
MTYSVPSFTLGIEEEYLLVDVETRDLVRETPPGLMEECTQALKGQVSPEFLQCQIEIGTRVCKSIKGAREDLQHLRTTIARLAGERGLAPIAASTHPFADWHKQRHTDKERYNVLSKDMGAVVQRMLICGMHVHVCVEDEDLRIDLFNQLSYFLPHLLAISTSSPFWQGQDTGLKSYRLTVFDGMPRTGLPPEFGSFGEYERTANVLVNAGLIEDTTKIWWDLRPSARFPTLEMRVCDVPTRLEDTIAIAAAYACITRMLYRLRRANQRWRHYPNFLIDENRWRAQRYGIEEGLIDFGLGAVVSYSDLLEELIELTREDAEAMDCVVEIEHLRDITANGSSADRQLKTYRDALEAGKDEQEALRDVVDMLVAETAGHHK